jgi:hypothetical protein
MTLGAGTSAPVLPPTGQVAKEEVDELVEDCDYHHDGEDLPKLPRLVDLDDAGPNHRPIFIDMCRVSMHLGWCSVKSG